mmetsp:Transcript_112053/g.349221  ORF Transcript_112053/g.349221 Transcript_112053/m.349221 type:complete len:251 (+) Transcript_112053:425-1177(+)
MPTPGVRASQGRAIARPCMPHSVRKLCWQGNLRGGQAAAKTTTASRCHSPQTHRAAPPSAALQRATIPNAEMLHLAELAARVRYPGGKAGTRTNAAHTSQTPSTKSRRNPSANTLRPLAHCTKRPAAAAIVTQRSVRATARHSSHDPHAPAHHRPNARAAQHQPPRTATRTSASGPMTRRAIARRTRRSQVSASVHPCLASLRGRDSSGRSPKSRQLAASRPPGDRGARPRCAAGRAKDARRDSVLAADA